MRNLADFCKPLVTAGVTCTAPCELFLVEVAAGSVMPGPVMVLSAPMNESTWPVWARVVAALTAVYVVVFQLPRLGAGAQYAVAAAQQSRWSALTLVVLALLCSALAVAIWVVTVWLTARGLVLTRKFAFGFLLAYLLLVTISAPFNYGLQWYRYSQNQKRVPTIPVEQRQAFAAMVRASKPSLAGGQLALSLPVGHTLLLLLAVALCRQDGVPLPRFRRVDSRGTP